VDDVGQNLIEEIDLVEKGKNYGWKIMEGGLCYNPSTDCDKAGLDFLFGIMGMMWGTL
jgi:hypothetical protein